jgi:hypothetical protein
MIQLIFIVANLPKIRPHKHFGQKQQHRKSRLVELCTIHLASVFEIINIEHSLHNLEFSSESCCRITALTELFWQRPLLSHMQ